MEKEMMAGYGARWKIMVDEQYFAGFCRQILNEHPSIRFAGLADRLGHLVAAAYRKDWATLMDSKDIDRYTFQTVMRAYMRETFEDKIGRLRYAAGLYEKLIMATIPIAFGGGRRRFYLMTSFDLDSDFGRIIEGKILPIVKEHKEYFM